jgi:hypothetical protein
MKRLVLACVALALAGPAVWPGVVIEMEVKDPDSAGAAAHDTIYAQGKMLRMDPHGSQGEKISMLFRDDTMWIIDHGEKRCHKIDKAGMEELSAQLSGVMKQLEEQLAQLPPEQRAMMGKMMKGKMGAAMPGLSQEATVRRGFPRDIRFHGATPRVPPAEPVGQHD